MARVREQIAASAALVGRSPESVRLVAVTKYVDAAMARPLLQAGCRDWGESRPQELWRKAALVTGGQWHAIGHLQRNKVERTLPLVSLIHSCDSLRLLEAIRICGRAKTTRFYQASSSEMFGKVQEIPQRETTPFYPRSPYGVAKVYAYWITVNYREAYGLYACNGILFNHESPLRGETFVTRKITRGLARIKAGLDDCLYLGNLDALRDWGHARDYVRAQWLMLQQTQAEDYVIATGHQYSVRTFVTRAAECLGIQVGWRGQGLEEHAIDKATGRTVVRIDPRYFRPTEVDTLLGDASKAKRQLGWTPEVSFEDLVSEMVESDSKLAERDALIQREGFNVYKHRE